MEWLEMRTGVEYRCEKLIITQKACKPLKYEYVNLTHTSINYVMYSTPYPHVHIGFYSHL